MHICSQNNNYGGYRKIMELFQDHKKGFLINIINKQIITKHYTTIYEMI